MKNLINEQENWKHFDEIRILGGEGPEYGRSAGQIISTDKSINSIEESILSFKEYAKTDLYLTTTSIKKLKIRVLGWTKGSLPITLGEKIIKIK